MMTFEDSLEQALKKIRITILKKHHDYGSNNILKYKDVGVVIRLNDKLSRMETLYGITDGSFKVRAAKNESIEDSWLDVAGYGVIGMMLSTNTFDLPSINDARKK